jgi:methylthioribulose-1-phosphate dehydratase
MIVRHADVHTEEEAKALICELGRQFYGLGWVSGTGGGIALRLGDEVFMAPSGTQKEALSPDLIFTLDLQGEIRNGPPASAGLRVSACRPLFLHAFNKRGAGAVIHSHSQDSVLATLLHGASFSATGLEMIKGIAGMGLHDLLEVPIIENTAEEADLADTLAGAMDAHPKSHAVLVRGHGLYVWGDTWMAAKRHAEVYEYLFSLTHQMKHLGIEIAART